MKRATFTLLIVVGLIAFAGKTAQAAPANSAAIISGVSVQATARHGHYGHRGYYGHYGPRPHYGYRPPVVYAPPRPVVVQPYIYRNPYYGHGSFYYSTPGFSIGFGY